MSLNGNIGVKYLGNIGKGKRNSDCAEWWCRGLWVPGKVFEGCLSPAGWWDGGCPGLFTTEGITAVKCGNNVRFLLWVRFGVLIVLHSSFISFVHSAFCCFGSRRTSG